MFKKIGEYITTYNLGRFVLNYSFKQLTTLRVGGNISLLFYPNSINSFIFFYKKICSLDEKIPLMVIGSGSNILASDLDYLGIVVSFDELDIKCIVVDKKAIAFPQMKVSQFARLLQSIGLSGGEFLCGIPGTIGGALCMNAGGFGCDMAMIVDASLLIDRTMEPTYYSKEQLQFAYRSSIIQKNNMIVLLAMLSFTSDEVDTIASKMKNMRLIRKNTQPTNALSAGCAFRNPGSLKAWKLIEEAKLRGFKYKGAMVSNIHANFIINDNNASAETIYQLLQYIKQEVYKNKHIELETEWILVNFEQKE